MGEIKCYLPLDMQLGSFLLKEPNCHSIIDNCVELPNNSMPIKIIGKKENMAVVFNESRIFAIFPIEYINIIYNRNPDFVDSENKTPIEELNNNNEQKNNNFIFKIVNEMSELKDNELIIVYN